MTGQQPRLYVLTQACRRASYSSLPFITPEALQLYLDYEMALYAAL
jgi:hypothetical protein